MALCGQFFCILSGAHFLKRLSFKAHFVEKHTAATKNAFIKKYFMFLPCIKHRR